MIRNALVVDPGTGLLHRVRQLTSPNCDERPPGVQPELIVIHGISLPPGEFGGPWIDALFTNSLDPAAHASFHEVARLRVSAHVLIGREGRLTQYVPFSLRAWHAGRSSHLGRAGCNDFSVGIELEGADEVPYAIPQYETLAGLVHALRDWSATLRTAPIVGHSDIAPGRKTDPGPAFDWGLLARMLER